MPAELPELSTIYPTYQNRLRFQEVTNHENPPPLIPKLGNHAAMQPKNPQTWQPEHAALQIASFDLDASDFWRQ
jgi:hypothetical protein